MNFNVILNHVKNTFEPKRYMTFKLSTFPTLIRKTIDFGQREGKSDAEILESVEKLAKKFEKQIEETGFNL